MSMKVSSILVSFTIAFLFGAYTPPATNADKESVLMTTIVNGLQKYHFQPRDIDDQLSEEMFDLYLERIDAGKRFLTQGDVKLLAAHKFSLDDEAQEGTYNLFNLSQEVLINGIRKSKGYFEEVINEDFDFQIDEMYESDADKRDFPADDVEMKKHWLKLIKYRMVNNILDKMEGQEEGEDKSFKELEQEARKSVKRTFERYFERLSKIKREDRLTTYLNAFTNTYDPHTGYFKPIDKQNFDINMSGTLEGIGARLQTDGDLTKVSSIVAGGPAWKQKDLEANDYILKVAQGDEEAIDIAGMTINEVVQLIRGKKGTRVELTVKKVDGSVQVVPIVRDVVILEEGYAKSLLLKYPEMPGPIGYIMLPRFYADFNGNGGPSSSVDVKNEVLKLSNHNVEGIILDLRNNGGGSLKDVVKMAGLFIEEGPIVQVKARERIPMVLKDKDPSVQFDKPLIILVNQFSASASEILAAALQDYGRAVIIGSTSTYGKGTVQRFIELDRISSDELSSRLGNLKLTIQKFYRVNGGSTQLKGVLPDIVLPDNYAFIETGERENDFAMKWSEIAAVPHEQHVECFDNLSKIKSKSHKRIENHDVFQAVVENATRLEKQRQKTAYNMNFEVLKAEDEQFQKESKSYDDLIKDVEGLEVVNPDEDLSKIEGDEGKKARNEDWLKSVKQDIYLEEALHVMNDMLK